MSDAAYGLIDFVKAKNGCNSSFKLVGKAAQYFP